MWICTESSLTHFTISLSLSDFLPLHMRAVPFKICILCQNAKYVYHPPGHIHTVNVISSNAIFIRQCQWRHIKKSNHWNMYLCSCVQINSCKFCVKMKLEFIKRGDNFFLSIYWWIFVKCLLFSRRFSHIFMMKKLMYSICEHQRTTISILKSCIFYYFCSWVWMQFKYCIFYFNFF